MKKRWVIFFIVLNAAILSVSVFCLVLTGRNVHLFNQDPDVSIHEEGDAYVMTATSGREYKLSLNNGGVKVIGSFKATREDCIDIIHALDSIVPKGVFMRSNSDLFGELRLHNFLYALGIARENTRDCDLDYICDKRWYVEATSKLIGWTGI